MVHLMLTAVIWVRYYYYFHFVQGNHSIQSSICLIVKPVCGRGRMQTETVFPQRSCSKPPVCCYVAVVVIQLCLTLCNPIDGSMPGVAPFPRACSNSCPLSQWHHPTISSSVVPFSSCPQSFPVSGSFQMSQLFASGGQSIGASAPEVVLPMNTQGWLTGLISLWSKGLLSLLQHHSSKASTLRHSAFFMVQLWDIHTWLLEKP